jgi:SAM-dependent methyltransferase
VGRVILNLGCGAKTSTLCVNIDWSMLLRLKRWRVGWLGGPARRRAIDALEGEIVVHDLRRGIPAADASVDAVYHSHLLEHIDRDAAPSFMAEIRRVLKPRGIQRIVVPDLELLARRYLEQFGEPRHDDRVAEMIEQIARREAYGTSIQPPLRRRIENVVLGDARRRGETHQWMYDRVSLARLLEDSGFVDINVVSYDRSGIPDWQLTQLDTLPNGSPYKPGSLYMEARVS